MAFDPAVTSVVLRAFVGVVSRWLQRRARAHGIRGVFRSTVVPAPNAPVSPRNAPRPEPTPYRLAWAELLRRVFLVDALDCPRCHGRMRIVAAVTEPGAIERTLRHLGESSAPPDIAVPRGPPREDEETAARTSDLPDPDPGEGGSA